MTTHTEFHFTSREAAYQWAATLTGEVAIGCKGPDLWIVACRRVRP